MAINGHVYSDASTETLLAQAVMLGDTLSGKIGSLESSAAESAEKIPTAASKPADAGASTAAPAEQKTETPSDAAASAAEEEKKPESKQ
jgi:hypothetical protein